MDRAASGPGAEGERRHDHRAPPITEQIRGLKGFGAKAEENVLKALATHEESGGPAARILLSRALPVAEEIATALRENPASDQVEITGSLRRLGDDLPGRPEWPINGPPDGTAIARQGARKRDDVLGRLADEHLARPRDR